MERRRVIVAFGDIRGSMSFWKRAVIPMEEKGRIWDAIYDVFETLEDKPEYHVKYNGDGFMVLRELKVGHNCKVAFNFFKDTQEVGRKVNRVIDEAGNILGGFTLRYTSGIVFKRFIKARKAKFPRFKDLKKVQGPKTEYLEYPIGLAARLKAAYPGIFSISHESATAILGNRIKGILVTPLKPFRPVPENVDPEDVKKLSSVTIEEKS